MFAYFSWLCLGCPDVGSETLLVYGANRLMTTGIQSSAECLLQDVLSFVRQPGALYGPPGGGRARVTQELQACLRQHYGMAAPSACAAGAQTVDLSRVDLPLEGGTVSVEKLLTEEQRHLYLDVESLCLPKESWPETPKPCHRVAPEAEDQLQDHLLSNRMAGLLEASKLPKRCDGYNTVRFQYFLSQTHLVCLVYIPDIYIYIYIYVIISIYIYMYVVVCGREVCSITSVVG